MPSNLTQSIRPVLLTVPNISAGSDALKVAHLKTCFEPLQLLDSHLDPDHDRAVFTLAGQINQIEIGLLSGAAAVFDRLELTDYAGVHPHVGLLDVCPVVYLSAEQRGAATAVALTVANLLAERFDLPIFLYGDLADGRERSDLRRGGPSELAARMHAGALVPDFGPAALHPTAGATLITARPPLVAFNLELRTASLDQARELAGRIRESGGGLPGVRALGLWLESKQRAQLSFNLDDPLNVTLAAIVERVRSELEIAQAELVGLAPAAAFDGFPTDLPIPGFDPQRHLIENALDRVQAAGSGR